MPKRRRHKCFRDVDRELKSKNTRLSCNLFNDNRIIVETEQIETGRGKKRRVLMIASYCPFCGESLEDDKTDNKPPERKLRGVRGA